MRMENETLGTVYEWIGGEKAIESIVNHFYPKVVEDPDLKPIFPEDITEVMRKQKMFLTQFFGGPPLYSMEFGAPMMRARHLPHEITPTRARAWLTCMSQALAEAGLTEEKQQFVLDRLAAVAQHMVNTPD